MRAAIVGAGIAGLACAAALEGRARATLVDRLPVVGGLLGYEHPDVVALAAAARAAGATIVLGATATTWDGDELVAVAPDGVHRIRAGALVLAAGTRPRTRAELGLAGDRPAGVVAATVACHLAETGLLVGRRPVIVGAGDWARRAVHELRAAGAEDVVVVAPDGEPAPIPGARIVVARPLAVRGALRVEALETDAGPLACDALVLAHGLVPARNVDGAVRGGPHVVTAQPVDDPGSVALAEAAGRAAAAVAIDIMEGR